MKDDYLPLMPQTDMLRHPVTRNLVGPQLSDRAEAEKVLLVDQKGSPLIVERPRPMGFRPK